MSRSRGGPKYSSSPMDLEYTSTMKEFNEMTMSEKEFDQPPTPSPPPMSFPFPAMRSASATSSYYSPSKRCANSRTETRHTEDGKEEKTESIEKVLVFKDEVKAAGESKKKTPKIITRPLKPAASLHARSKSASSLSKARPPVSSQTTSPHDDDTPIKTSAAIPTKLEILEQLQNIAQTRAEMHLQLLTLDKQEKTLLSLLLDSELSTTTPELSSENDISTERPPNCTLTLPPYLAQPTPIPVSSPHQPRKKPQLLPPPPPPPPRQPISAPPQSTPSRLLTGTPSTSNRVPLSDKTEVSLATFDSTPIFARPAWDLSPVKSRNVLEATEGVAHAFDEVMRKGKGKGEGIRVPMKFGDGNHEEIAKEGEVETGRPEVTDRGREMIALVDRPIRSAVRTATPGKRNTTSGDYEIPYTVQRKDWRF